MIDPVVEGLAKAFIDFAKKQTHGKSAYRLDFSLTSMTTLDIILSSRNTPRTLSEKDEELIKGAAAYLGIATYTCWQEMTPRPKIKLVSRTASQFEIALEVVSGPHILEEKIVKINLVSTLRKLIENTPNPFPSFEKFIVPRTPHMDIIYCFAKGLLSGLSPYLNGPWKDIPAENFTQQLRDVSVHLAIGVSRYFAFRFSQDQILSRPALFTESILLPPIGYEEEFPLIRSTHHLIKSLQALEAQEKEIEQVALHLIMTPDSSLNSLGFILASVFEFQNLKQFAKSFAASLYLSGNQFKPALHLARRLLKKPSSYLECLSNKDEETALALLREEYRLGIIPFFSEAPSKHTLNMPLILLETLRTNNLEEALGAFYIQKDLTTPNAESFIATQIIYLNALSGKFDQGFVDSFPDLDEKSKSKTEFPYASSYHKIRLLFELHYESKGELIKVLAAYIDYLSSDDPISLVSAHDSYLFYQASKSIIKQAENEIEFNELITKLSQIALRSPEIITPEIFVLLCIDQQNQKNLLNLLPDNISYMLERSYWNHTTAFINFKD